MLLTNRFPMFRLATLLARQLSSPFAARIKRYAVSHPRFGEAVCIRVAETYHVCEWRIRRLALRLAGASLPAGARAPPPLPARIAINLGGDLLGEIIIFILGSLIVIFEVNRQANKQELKELDEKSKCLAILLSLEELKSELVLQQADIDRMHAALLQLEQQQHSNNTSNYKPQKIAQTYYASEDLEPLFNFMI